jgi:hypothetical protein
MTRTIIYNAFTNGANRATNLFFVCLADRRIVMDRISPSDDSLRNGVPLLAQGTVSYARHPCVILSLCPLTKRVQAG